MADNTIETLEEMNNEQYIAAIEELKATTISKDTYNKLRAENKRLLDALVTGKDIPGPKEEKPTVEELRKTLFNKDKDLTNLEFVETALSLRNSLIEAGERDPFLPYGDKIVITAEQIDSANHVAEVLSDCVEFAQGDSGIFTAELQRRTKDVMVPRRR